MTDSLFKKFDNQIAGVIPTPCIILHLLLKNAKEGFGRSINL